MEPEYRPIRARIEVPPALSYRLDSEIIAEVTRHLPQHLEPWTAETVRTRARVLLEDPAFFRNWLLARYPEAIVGYTPASAPPGTNHHGHPSALARFLASKVGSCFSMWEGGLTVFPPEPTQPGFGLPLAFPVPWPQEYLALEGVYEPKTPITVATALVLLDRAVETPILRLLSHEVVLTTGEADND